MSWIREIQRKKRIRREISRLRWDIRFIAANDAVCDQVRAEWILDRLRQIKDLELEFEVKPEFSLPLE